MLYLVMTCSTRAPAVKAPARAASPTPRRNALIDLRKAFAGLPEPADISLPFNRLVQELLSRVTDPVVMAYALTLLDGDDPSRHPTALRYMGGGHADILLSNYDYAFWPAVWGARALQYVWTPVQAAEATRLVVRHLGDDRWRLAEMCAKVVRKRELGEGADAVAKLTGHRLPRVRMEAVRALGAVGETEHLPLIHGALQDPDKDVRRAAVKAMQQRADRLDLDLDELLAGRFR